MADFPEKSLLAAVRSQLTLDSDSDQSSSPAHNDQEPFPVYEESAAVDVQHEEAYKYAFAKAVQDQIRSQQVDPKIVPISLATENGHSMQTQALDAIKELLSLPQLRKQTRDRFIALTNMTLRLNHVLFCRGDDFLAPRETTDAKDLASTILMYLAWMDEMLQEHLQTASQVAFIVGQISQEEEVTVYVRYRRMASVVTVHLKKPRPLERRLLTLYLELYEGWVHTAFLHRRNRQILQEEKPNPDRLELSRFLLAIWDVMTRCIENYAVYTSTTRDIREKYFTPALQQLCDSAEVWEQCFEVHAAQ
ncbi:hypothetical protein NUU61_009572 [Penicillium alfredii]|uniref:Uncharacterized protein n=1 Tax=Penicillium alfredii TaxID=1506179 RepID=A0A9W9EGC5_9EURO|nr:uncharacterized protein NUU61_009572 [Penicillium alfredii]KAJ5081308.1 hypothetical protein NUU61_009572 [Penicillium alfredii]